MKVRAMLARAKIVESLNWSEGRALGHGVRGASAFAVLILEVRIAGQW